MALKKWLTVLVTVTVLSSLVLPPVMASANGSGCPAAPAVAGKLLREAGLKVNGFYISAVAREMGPGTCFHGVPKSDVEKYKNAVKKYLQDLGVVFPSSPDDTGSDDTGDLPDGMSRKIVVFKSGTGETAKETVIRRSGATKIRSLSLVNAVAIITSPTSEVALLERSEVVRIDPDAIVTTQAKPPSPPGQDKKPKPEPEPEPQPAQQEPWGITHIEAPDAWGISMGSGIKMAILDTGIQLDHPDLKTNIKGGINIINSQKSPADDNGHGTHVAGIIGALDNDIGVVGVAPDVQLYAVKVLNKQGSGYVSDIISGLTWCIDNGIDVVNMSFGSSTDVKAFREAVKAAHNAGMVLVAAAGNSGPKMDTVSYPAKYVEVIAVSATDSEDSIASFSSRGSEIELAAPGVTIKSTYTGSSYKVFSGTSMAAPHVAGVAALVWADNGRLTNEGVRSVLHEAATELGTPGRDSYYGFGLVNAYRAVVRKALSRFTPFEYSLLTESGNTL
jgi:subtilisin family serine protease